MDQHKAAIDGIIGGAGASSYWWLGQLDAMAAHLAVWGGALLVVLRGYLMIIEWRNARRERAIVRIEDC